MPTLLLGVVLTLLTWSLQFAYPAPGIDPSWRGGLYLAVDDGLDFGREIVFTYGPLGFLEEPINWDTTLASISFLFGAALAALLACAVVWSLRRTFGTWPAVLIAFVLLSALGGLVEAVVPIAAVLCFTALAPDRPPWALNALTVGGALLGATYLLLKLSLGPPVVAMGLLALLGARASVARIAAFAGTSVAWFVILWLATSQPLGAIPDYISNSRGIISGYSDSMGIGDPEFQAQALLRGALGVVVLTAGACFASYRDGRARAFGVALAALAAFSTYKGGIVRLDVGHLAVYFSTVVMLWTALCWDPSRWRAALTGLIVMCALALPSIDAVTSSWRDVLDPARSADLAVDQIDLFASPTERSDRADEVRAFLALGYGLDDPTLALLEGQSVAIVPSEIAAAYAFDLDWDPVPVIQGYQALTPDLDRLNGDALASPDGPERILKLQGPAGDPEDESIDGRLIAWDPPQQAIAELCNFEPLRTTDVAQVLGRVPDRCSELEPLGTVDSSYGETVHVPEAEARHVVLAEIHGAGVGGIELLRSFLYKGAPRIANVNGDREYRLVPGTAADGLLMNGDPSVAGEGPFSVVPQVRTIAVIGREGELRYDFYSMGVRPTTRSGATVRGKHGG